jgi:hypothetical protein
MAFGKRNSGIGGKLLVFRLKSKDANDAVLVPNKFQISVPPEVEGGEWTTKPDYEQEFEGDLIKVDFDEGEYEGKTYDIVRLYFKDSAGEYTYLFDGRLSSVSRSLYLALANLQTFDGIRISLYAKPDAEGKQWTNVSVWQGDTMIKSALDWKTLPKPDIVKNKKGEIISRDYTDLDEIVKAELVKLAERVEAAQKNGGKKNAAAPAPSVPAQEQEDSAPNSKPVTAGKADKKAGKAGKANPAPTPEVLDEDVPFNNPR